MSIVMLGCGACGGTGENGGDQGPNAGRSDTSILVDFL